MCWVGRTRDLFPYVLDCPMAFLLFDAAIRNRGKFQDSASSARGTYSCMVWQLQNAKTVINVYAAIWSWWQLKCESHGLVSFPLVVTPAASVIVASSISVSESS